MMKLLIFLFVVSCGSGGQRYREVPQQQPPGGFGNGGGNGGLGNGGNRGGGGTVSFTTVKPIIDEQCALSGCHAGAAFLESGPAFKASASRQRISSGNMPRQNRNSGQYSDEKRNLLLQFLGS
jgi:hypothetical protein